MEFNRKEIARGAVLRKLGLASLVSTSRIDISEFHHAHVERQAIPARYIIDGLTIDAPSGIYHPDAGLQFGIVHPQPESDEH